MMQEIPSAHLTTSGARAVNAAGPPGRAGFSQAADTNGPSARRASSSISFHEQPGRLAMATAQATIRNAGDSDLETLHQLNRNYVRSVEESDVRWFDEHLAADFL